VALEGHTCTARVAYGLGDLGGLGCDLARALGAEPLLYIACALLLVGGYAKLAQAVAGVPACRAKARRGLAGAKLLLPLALGPVVAQALGLPSALALAALGVAGLSAAAFEGRWRRPAAHREAPRARGSSLCLRHYFSGRALARVFGLRRWASSQILGGLAGSRRLARALARVFGLRRWASSQVLGGLAGSRQLARALGAVRARYVSLASDLEVFWTGRGGSFALGFLLLSFSARAVLMFAVASIA
jgi:hypothetical protein